MTRLAVLLVGLLALGLFAYQYADISLIPDIGVIEPDGPSIDYLSMPWEEYLVGLWEITDEGYIRRHQKFSAEPQAFYLIDMELNPGEVLLEGIWTIRESDLEWARIEVIMPERTSAMREMELVRTSFDTFELYYADVVLSTWRRLADEN